MQTLTYIAKVYFNQHDHPCDARIRAPASGDVSNDRFHFNLLTSHLDDSRDTYTPYYPLILEHRQKIHPYPSDTLPFSLTPTHLSPRKTASPLYLPLFGVCARACRIFKAVSPPYRRCEIPETERNRKGTSKATCSSRRDERVRERERDPHIR